MKFLKKFDFPKFSKFIIFSPPMCTFYLSLYPSRKLYMKKSCRLVYFSKRAIPGNEIKSKIERMSIP